MISSAMPFPGCFCNAAPRRDTSPPLRELLKRTASERYQHKRMTGAPASRTTGRKSRAKPMNTDVMVLMNNAEIRTDTLGGESTFKKRFNSAYVLPAATPSKSMRKRLQIAYLTPVLITIPGRKMIVTAESNAFRVQVLNALRFPESNIKERIKVATTTTSGAYVTENKKFAASIVAMSTCTYDHSSCT